MRLPRALMVLLCVMAIISIYALRHTTKSTFESGQSHDLRLFSSSTSPDGQWNSENYGYILDDKGGFISLRKNGKDPSLHKIELDDADPYIFLIWVNPNTLKIFKENKNSTVVAKQIEGVNIIQEVYNANQRFKDGAVKTYNVDLSKDSVSASFDQQKARSNKTGREYNVCVLAINAVDGTYYDRVGVELKVGPTSCGLESVCYDGQSNFWVGTRIDGKHGEFLTSAAISGIPSYSRIPYGAEYKSVNGQFMGDNADMLIHNIGGGAVDIMYSLNFFGNVISYHVPTQSMTSQIKQFLSCISGAK